jgi:hypothetical protein
MDKSDVLWALAESFGNMSYPITKDKLYTYIKYEGSKKELDTFLKDFVKEGSLIKMGKHYELSPRFKGEISVKQIEDRDNREMGELFYG